MASITPVSDTLFINGEAPTIRPPYIYPDTSTLVITEFSPTLVSNSTFSLPRSSLPLTALMPLRATSEWGQFDDVQTIGHRIGSCAGKMLVYDNTRALWVWAGHACGGVDSVTVGGLPVNNWQWRNGVDNAGLPVCFVEFDSPIDEGITPVGHGRGKLLDNGTLMENPADVIWYIRSVIAGQRYDASDIDQFRFECANNDVTVSGSINDRDLTIQGQIKQIVSSIAGFWSAQMPGVAKLVPAFDYITSTVTPVNTSGIQANCDHSDLINCVTIEYDYIDGAATQSMTLEATESVMEYGRRAETLPAPWVATTRVAEQVGRRYLQRSARPQWVIDISTVPGMFSLGDGVNIDHVHAPVAGGFMVSGVQIDLDSSTSNVTVAAPAGAEPLVKLTHTASQSDPVIYPSALVNTQGDQRVLTLTDANRQPLAGASVLLDGQYPRTSDAAGRVVFPADLTPPGEHTLIATSGSISIEWVITI